jgi:hypothetical protein
MSTQKQLILGGALVLVLTNAIALIGVVYNRQAPPESVLDLTERELSPHGSWMWENGENSGLDLRLKFRTEPIATSVLDVPGGSHSYLYNGATPWLDRSKLAALGFDVETLTSADVRTNRQRMLGRDVLLVLELDGPAHERALQSVRSAAAGPEAAATANPQDSGLAERARNARQVVQEEAETESRLFVVDAGLNRGALERQYGNRRMYAIVRGQVQPLVVDTNASAKIYGMVTAIRCDDINVPLQFRAAVSTVRPFGLRRRVDPHRSFRVRLAFGRNLEPWIVSADRD